MIKKYLSIAVTLLSVWAALEIGKIAFFEYLNRQGSNAHLYLCHFAMDGYTIAALYFFCFIFNNMTAFDIYWGLSPIYKVYVFYNLQQKSYDPPKFGMNVIQLIYISLILIWSIRLALNLLMRWTGFPEQDFRLNVLEYKARKKGSLVYWIFVGFPWAFTNFLAMTLITFPLTKQFFRPVTNETNIYEIIGILIMITALVFEASGDHELIIYRNDKNPNKPKILDSGFRRYLRYPQYLGETLIWLGVYVFTMSNFHFDGWLDYPIGYLIFTPFMYNSAKIMEKHMQKKPEYQEYQKKVPFYLIPMIRFRD